ncbi:hypothetical protein DPMN_036130 [Dreissena polymorpha]|uniref:Uncharacterized protein n=1 Tax=Dreissena polymorpha TaxID=45954 RepID=A0A9D4MCD7_DREPO|nr:hypothetical protein DPMN_036130 [Dreissena polymorpha]
MMLYTLLSPAIGGGILFWALSVLPSVRPALLCPEPYLGSALADIRKDYPIIIIFLQSLPCTWLRDWFEVQAEEVIA